MELKWTVSNDSPAWLNPRRTVYFLTRMIGGRCEYFCDNAGRLRTFKTRVKALKVADRINAA